MKSVFAFLIVVAGCSEPQAPPPQSIVDSNTIDTGDSTPAILHLDNFSKDSSIEVALDSMGPTVDAADTAKIKE